MSVDRYDVLMLIYITGAILLGVAVWLSVGLAAVIGYAGVMMMAIGILGTVMSRREQGG